MNARNLADGPAPGRAQAQLDPRVDEVSDEKRQQVQDTHVHNEAAEHKSEEMSSSSEDAKNQQSPQDAEKGGQPKDAPTQRSKGKIALIMLALGLATFLAALDITIVTTAVPTISRDLNSNSGYSWIGSAYLLGAAASTPLWGKFSDIFGRKPVILVANALFFVSSMIAALSVSIGMLIAARSLQGIGGGGLIVLTNISIGDLFSQRQRGAYYGMIGGVWALASSLGPILGGAFTEDVTWRWCFWINLPFDGLAFGIILFFLDIKNPRTPVIQGLKAIDWLGAGLLVGGVLMLLLGLQFGGEEFPWDSAKVICLIVFGVVTLILFGIVEWKVAKYPIIPLRIFRVTSNTASLGVCFVQSFVFIAGSYYLPLYFQAVLGATPLLSGVYLLATSFSLSFTSIATGIIIRKTGKYVPLIIGGICIMTLGYGLYIDLDADSSWAKIILYQIVGGIGTGPNFQAPLIALQTGINPGDIGAATACFGLARNMAAAVSVVVGGVVYQNLMASKQASLAARLGPGAARALSTTGIGASSAIVGSLPPSQRPVAEAAFADSLHWMWVMYTAFCALGIVAGFGVVRKTLTKEHTETKTGLQAEEDNRQQALRDDEARREKKRKSSQR